jgi:hypothetical protein
MHQNFRQIGQHSHANGSLVQEQNCDAKWLVFAVFRAAKIMKRVI